MMTRHKSRPDRQIRSFGRRSVGVAAVAVLACVLTGTVATAPAQAAAPLVAQTWASLMYRSFVPTATAVRLASALVTQQATFVIRVTAVKTAKTADAAAQTQLTAATAADGSARSRYATALTALATAKASLVQASRKRPRSASAVSAATNAVTVATTTTQTRKTQAQQAAIALTAAQTGGRTATARLNAAIAAWKAANLIIRQTQAKIAALPTGVAYATLAASTSRDVVTQSRPVFTIADTTTVYDITVNKTVAFTFKRMLDTARAQGIVMSGGGFRTKQRQIELRTINGCPNVWTAPSSSCRVPTAIPGRSLHEIGLAVDITAGGRTITANSPAFTWLALHAARYGFVNLPSEPWHWSITGG